MAEAEAEDREDGQGDEDVAVFYTDALSGKRRRMRGKRRRKPRGQYSTDEKNMVRAFQRLIGDIHYMDGELADRMARYFTSVFVLGSQAAVRFSFENVPDPQREDWEELEKELGIAVTEVRDTEEGFDVGKLMLGTRARRRAYDERVRESYRLASQNARENRRNRHPKQRVMRGF